MQIHTDITTAKKIQEDMMLELNIFSHILKDLQERLKKYETLQKDVKTAKLRDEYTKKLNKTKKIWEKHASTAEWDPIPFELYVENNIAMMNWLWLSDKHKPVFGNPRLLKGRGAWPANKRFYLPGRILIDSYYGEPRDVIIEERQRLLKQISFVRKLNCFAPSFMVIPYPFNASMGLE